MRHALVIVLLVPTAIATVAADRCSAASPAATAQGAPIARRVPRHRRQPRSCGLTVADDAPHKVDGRYVVEAADQDADGMSIAADALRLNGGTIRDLAGNDVSLDLGRHAIHDGAGHAVDGGGRPDRD